ncbi:hypothetical protein GCM10023175_29020 [Pseudonocardia xishanensis]|uniref:Hydantoinase B/oxoprolinase domain-containing protein n=1 Tax=Pseudonocardia xishanensis TaxID=630995 RepID=A0ABP8RSM9_9PSEU
MPEQLGFSGYVLMHLASSLGGVRAITDIVDMDALRPGDGFLTNDPRYGGAMHQADVALITPTFYRDELVGWSFSNMHVLDIGGVGVSGFAPGAHDVYEEGLRFPPVKVIRDGRLDREWERFIAANVRTPDPVLNDIRGMIAANTGVAAERLVAIIDEFGLDIYRELTVVNKALSEQVMRQRVERMPDGVYRVTDWHEFDGHDGPDRLLEVTGTMTVSGSDLRFAFTGTSQVDAFVNSAPSAMEANFMDSVMTSMVYGDFPVNADLWPVTISVGEPGTVVNSTDPAPCSNAHAEIGTRACKITRAVRRSPSATGRTPTGRPRRPAAASVRSRPTSRWTPSSPCGARSSPTPAAPATTAAARAWSRRGSCATATLSTAPASTAAPRCPRAGSAAATPAPPATTARSTSTTRSG